MTVTTQAPVSLFGTSFTGTEAAKVLAAISQSAHNTTDAELLAAIGKLETVYAAHTEFEAHS